MVSRNPSLLKLVSASFVDRHNTSRAAPAMQPSIHSHSLLATARCTQRGANFFDYNMCTALADVDDSYAVFRFWFRLWVILCAVVVFGLKLVSKRKWATFNDQVNFRTLAWLVDQPEIPGNCQPCRARFPFLNYSTPSSGWWLHTVSLSFPIWDLELLFIFSAEYRENVYLILCGF